MTYVAALAVVAIGGVCIGSWYGPRIAFGEKTWADLGLATLAYGCVVYVFMHAALAVDRRWLARRVERAAERNRERALGDED